MIYSIIFSEEAEHEAKKLDNNILQRIVKKLEEASNNPFQFFERLSGREDYKLRIGDYRVIAKILTNDKEIFVISMGHRKNVYKYSRSHNKL